MPRTKEFDERDVLRDAMAVFWEKGFARASIRDLEEATGLKAPSIYNAFGNKAELYLRALEAYVTAVGELFAAPLHEPGAGLRAIEDMFSKLRRGMWSEDARPGCLAIHTLPRNLPDTSAAFELVNRYTRLFKRGFEACLCNEGVEEALRKGLVDTLWTLTVGLNHLHRSHGPGPELERAFEGLYATFSLIRLTCSN